WCGFCRKLISLKNQGLEAWDERFDHIDTEHFRKGQKITNWLPPSGHRTKEPGDNSTSSESTSQEDDKCDNSIGGLEEESDHTGVNTADAYHISAESDRCVNASVIPRDKSNDGSRPVSSSLLPGSSGP